MSKPSLGRRALLIGAGAVGVGVAGAALYGVSAGRAKAAYGELAATLRAPLAAGSDMRELIRYATLAANSHNTQPWRFSLGANAISILPDLTRRTLAVDPDDHHLFTSLGCATENLVIAAAARGLLATPVFDPAGDGAIGVSLAAAPATETAAFRAIPERQVTRADYDGKAVAPSDLDQILAAAHSEDVDVLLLTDPAHIERVLGLVVEGNNAQYADPAYVAELKHWLRFDESQALANRDGLFSATTGNPTLPSWLGPLLFGLVVTAKGESDTAARQIRSSAGLAIFVGKAADKAHWVAAGRAYQRFALAATALGVKHAFVNQAVEVEGVRAKLAAEIGLPDRRPDLIVRFGYGPPMPKSLRRPADAVIV